MLHQLVQLAVRPALAALIPKEGLHVGKSRGGRSSSSSSSSTGVQELLHSLPWPGLFCACAYPGLAWFVPVPTHTSHGHRTETRSMQLVRLVPLGGPVGGYVSYHHMHMLIVICTFEPRNLPCPKPAGPKP